MSYSLGNATLSRCLIISAASPVEEMEEQVLEADQPKPEEETNRTQQKPEELQQQSVPVKQEMTEEDLEDWLDSMIS